MKGGTRRKEGRVKHCWLGPAFAPNDHPIKRIKCSDGNREKGSGDHAISAGKKGERKRGLFRSCRQCLKGPAAKDQREDTNAYPRFLF